MTVWAQNSSGPGLVNIAVGQPAQAYTQSSHYRADWATASNAANGDTSGVYTRDNCIHSATGPYYPPRPNATGGDRRYDREPWWQVDLQIPHYVYNFRIWGRTAQIGRLYPFNITVDDRECVYVKRAATRDITVHCTRPLYGRVVRITRKSRIYWDHTLNMCEFQIFVCNPGFYGINCSLHCSSNCCKEGCYMNDGKCIKCKPGWYGDQCKTECPSKHCLDQKCDQRSGVCLACDNGHFIGNQCLGCEPGWYGDGCGSRCLSPNCRNNRCDQQSGVCFDCARNFLGTNCSACRPGKHGYHCQNRCPQNCDECEQDSGQCTKCRFYNRNTLDCTECKQGTFGSNCTKLCGHCKDHRPCERENGHCTHCQPGWDPPLCKTKCGRFLYGSDCRYRCGQCQNNDVCDLTTGHCPYGCHEGYDGPRCDSQEGESGPEVWYIVVTILAAIVVILLATLAVFVCRKRIARTREMTRRKIQNETEVQELSDLEGGGPGRNLLVQPAEEVEGLYSEINDLPSFPCEDAASAMLAADKPEELGAQSPDTYDRPGVYMNATEDRQLYEKVQTGSNVLYQNCTKEKL
ncbi:hypothetical protein ACOMHN_027964 [Nucella lapillus]